jgi:hypothetical protein
VHPEAARGSQGCIAQESLIAIGKMAVRLSCKSKSVKSGHLRDSTTSHLAKLAMYRGDLKFSYARSRRGVLMTAFKGGYNSEREVSDGAISIICCSFATDGANIVSRVFIVKFF